MNINSTEKWNTLRKHSLYEEKYEANSIASKERPKTLT